MTASPGVTRLSGMEAIVILCTAPGTGEAAVELARGLVEQKLAACVNVVSGVRSLYSWKGQIEDDSEVQLLIKTRRELYPVVESWLKKHHPYEEPEILALPVERGSESYLAWLGAQTEP